MVVHQYVEAYGLVNGLIAKNAKFTIVRSRWDQILKKRIENLYRLPLNSVHIWMVERRREHEDDELLEDIIV